jgi:hypothetical protein
MNSRTKRGYFMLHDRYGLELSTTSTTARDAYIKAVDAVLSATDDAEPYLRTAIEVDPSFALSHAVYARVHQLSGRMAEAKLSGEKAVQLATNATDRERQHANIFQLLTSGQGPKGLELIKSHIRQYQRDAFALAPACSVFGLIGFSGRLGREDEQVALLEPLQASYGDDWWFLTVYGFALVEVGEWKRGRDMVEKAIEQRPRSAHTVHVLAHALYEAGEDKLLADYLENWLPGYSSDCLLNCHVWWHLCLAKLMIGEHNSVFEIYDQHCAPTITNSPSINVFTDGASLLWRSELAGIERSKERWNALLDFRISNFPKPMVFVDAHGALPSIALGNNTDLDAWNEAVKEAGENGKLPAGTVPADLARAFSAHAKGDWNSVISILEPMSNDVVRIGGSRAQRDLVQNTLLSAFVQDGRPEAARSFLNAQPDRAQTVPILGFN